MRCMSCGAEMRLLQTERDDTMGAPGYQRQTLQCTTCNEIERRTIYTGESASKPIEAVPPAASPAASIAPAPSIMPDTSAAPVVSITPVASILSEADQELDEGEVMLRRAIEMVRGPARSAVGLTGIAPPKKSSPSRLVRIRYDAQQEPAAYVASDSQSGLVVLRHQDRARLQAMCERLGWQVVIDAEASAPVTNG